MTGKMTGGGALLAWGFIAIALLFLYAPLVPPAINSFSELTDSGSWLQHYEAIFEDQRLMKAARTSAIVGLLVAITTPILALIAAEAVRVWGVPKLVIGVVLIPLFVP